MESIMKKIKKHVKRMEFLVDLLWFMKMMKSKYICKNLKIFFL